AVVLIPYSLIGPFAGVLLDRWRRQRTLVDANLVRALCVLVVVAITAADVTGIPYYSSVLVVISVSRFILSGLSASLPHVVGADRCPCSSPVIRRAARVHRAAAPHVLPWPWRAALRLGRASACRRGGGHRWCLCRVRDTGRDPPVRLRALARRAARPVGTYP